MRRTLEISSAALTSLAICALLLALLLFNAGCQTDPDFTPERRVIIQNSESALSARVDTTVRGTLEINLVEAAGGRTLSKPDYSLLLLAEVAPPVFEGKTLRASYVEIDGNLAYVAYNTEGEEYLGGVEIYDLRDEENPRLVSQAIFPFTDVSAVATDGSRLFLAEATDADRDTDFETPAVLEIMELERGLLTDDGQRLSIKGYVATGIKAEKGEVFITSATSGGLTVVDSETLSVSSFTDIENARDLSVKGDVIAVAQGAPGRIQFVDRTSATLGVQYHLGGAGDVGARTGIDYLNDNLVFAAGAEGVLLLDTKTGSVSKAVELVWEEGVDPADVVANSVSVNEGLILMANGAAGLYVAKSQGQSIELQGTIDLGASANVVKSKGNILVVATGTGGLKIIGIKR